jgi:hypothetical protein
MTALRAWLFTLVCIATVRLVVAMVNPSTGNMPQKSTSRRNVLNRLPFLVIGVTSSVAVTNIQPTATSHNGDSTTNCRCTKCESQRTIYNPNQFIINAYERRDVGGADASGETKAMNDQAYETNNRLERDGLVLEVRNIKK